MNYTNIPSTNLKSSALAFGCDSIGSRIDERTSFELLNRYVEMGGNHLDTANLYGGGASETTIGKWIKERGGRDNLIIATKGAHPNTATMNIPRLSYKEIQSDLDQSLKRLGCDYIDLYWLHRDCIDVDVSGIIDSMNSFVKQGKIRYIGCSNWKSNRIRLANEYAAKTGQAGFCASQIKWSLASTSPDFKDDPTLVEMDTDEFEFYKNSNLAVLAFASQGKGFFTKMEQGGRDNLSIKSNERYYCPENIKRFEKAQKLAQEKNVNISSIILAYLYSQSFPVIPIIGCSNLLQLNDSVQYSDSILTEEEIKFLQ